MFKFYYCYKYETIYSISLYIINIVEYKVLFCKEVFRMNKLKYSGLFENSDGLSEKIGIGLALGACFGAVFNKMVICLVLGFIISTTISIVYDLIYIKKNVFNS